MLSHIYICFPGSPVARTFEWIRCGRLDVLIQGLRWKSNCCCLFGLCWQGSWVNTLCSQIQTHVCTHACVCTCWFYNCVLWDTSSMDGSSFKVRYKQLKNFRKFLKLSRFTRSLPPQACVSSKGWIHWFTKLDLVASFLWLAMLSLSVVSRHLFMPFQELRRIACVTCGTCSRDAHMYRCACICMYRRMCEHACNVYLHVYIPCLNYCSIAMAPKEQGNL